MGSLDEMIGFFSVSDAGLGNLKTVLALSKSVLGLSKLGQGFQEIGSDFAVASVLNVPKFKGSCKFPVTANCYPL